MQINPLWLSAFANMGTAVSLILAWRQFTNDHERSRRERAVDLIASWARHADRRGAASRKLVEKFSFEQAKELFAQEPLGIDTKYRGLLSGVIADADIREKDGKLWLDEKHSSELRWIVVTYLNNLEAVMCSWRHNVSDRQMLEEQFRFLVSPAEGRFILEKFREAAGGFSSYPAIGEFVKHLRAENSKTPPGKDAIA